MSDLERNGLIKLCGYSCEHNKGGVCQITVCDKKIVMTTTTNEPFEKRFNVKYDEQGVEKFNHWLDPTIEEYKKEIDRLNNIINQADTKNLELIQKINKIYDVIENKNITGVEARLLIQDILDKEE